MSADFHELDDFAALLADGNAKLPGLVVKALGISALKGKRAWQTAAKGSRHLPAYPSSIDYDDVKISGGDITTELGPNLGRNQGSLGIVEDSPGGVRGAPQRNYVKAEKVIEDDLPKGLLKAAADSLKGA